MPTDTFEISAAGDDGSGYREVPAASGWGAISTGAFANEAGAVVYVDKYATATTFYGQNGFLRFDTSALPDSLTITAATLKLYLATRTNTTGTSYLEADYYDFGGEPTVVGDWILTVGASILNSTTATGSLTVSAVNNFTLNDFSGINPSGITGIRLAISSISVVNSVLETLVGFAAYEDAVNPSAQLEVTYTEAGGAEKQSFYAFRRRSVTR